MLNPLMPDINLCTQCSLPRFFYWGFKLHCLLLGGKKAHLVDFSFKFNEIKFCTLLMNWLMCKKIFSYFYNKFRPVNCMLYIKCVVNSSLLTLFWLLQAVYGNLSPCFIMTHYSQRGCFTNLLSCDFLRNSAPQTGLLHI